jgi:hypothetical protein
LIFISSLTFLNDAFSMETIQCPMMGWLRNDELEKFRRKWSLPNGGTIPEFA